MIGGHLVRLIERHADDLAEGLTKKLRNSDRTSEFRKIPEEELKKGAREIYHNLGDWLLTKTESDIEVRYTQLGTRRATQGSQSRNSCGQPWFPRNTCSASCSAR